MNTTLKNNPKVMNAWAFYDWSNSVYALVINSTIFPIYYTAITKGENFNFLGINFLPSEAFAHSLSIAFILVIALIFILSPIADYTGKKKLFMKYSCYFGALSCLALFFVDSSNSTYALLLNMSMAIAFYLSLVFYNSYLPDIATKDKHDELSSKGFIYGYIGSVLLLVFCLGLIMGLGGDDSEKVSFYTRLSFVLTGIWWAGFAQYSFKYLPCSEPLGTHKSYVSLIKNSFKEMKKVARSLLKDSALKVFLSSFFFYSVGMQTIFFMATIFGDVELGLEAHKLIITILLLQIVAIAGAKLFSVLAIVFGNKPVLLITISIWATICILAFFMNKNDQHVEYMFYAIASLVGLVMGGIQALSRSTYSKLLPETKDSTTYFSFYDIIEKLALVLGTFTFGAVNGYFKSMSYSALSMGIFFIIGFIILCFLKTNKLKPYTK